MLKRLLVWIFAALACFAAYLGFTAFKATELFPQIPLLNSNDLIRAKLKLENWVPLGEISPLAVGAIVTSEDDRFYLNQGFELNSIKDAFEADLKSGRFKRGASTITQQVVKNVFLNREKSIRRKVEELVLAREVEKSVSKDRILEVYLNTAQFGASLYGIEAASSFYFAKTPVELTAREGAFLAMLLPSPVRYARSFSEKKLTPYAEKTIGRLLQRMADRGRLTPAQFYAESSAKFAFEEPAPEPTKTPLLGTPAPSPTETFAP